MYKTVNVKTKLFTKLTNQNSYDEARAISNIILQDRRCKRCIKRDPTLPCQYIGQTSRTLRERFREHRRGIQNNIDESVPIHFNQPKHTLNDVQLIPILHLNNDRDSNRLSMEQHLIEKAGTLQNGINRACDHCNSYLVVLYSIYILSPVLRHTNFDWLIL